MEAKISQAQKEVWEWKESLFQELKNVPGSERLQYIREKTRSAVEQIKRAREKKAAVERP